MNPRVLEAFPDARLGRDDWYVATCPAHTDEHPSLGFRQMDDGWVAFKCRSQGCARDVILDAAGLALVDIGPERPATNGQRKPDHEAKRWRVGEWLHIRYEDAEGHKTRVPWAFVDGSLCPSGKGPKTAELPLYGAEFLADLADGATVYVAEGEKSADALRWAGVIGLATVTGADGMPCDDSLRPLLRFCVRLWPDNDANGARHMERIATRLALLGCRQIEMVRWPDAPEKGDAADLLRPFAQAKDSNGATDALEALPLEAWAADVPTMVGTLEFPVRSVDDVLAGPSSEPLVGDWISRGGFASLYGPEWSGKSLGGLALTLCIASGQPWLGIDVPQAATLYVVSEGLGGLPDRIAAWQHGHPDADVRAWSAHTSGFSFADPRQVETLLVYVQAVRPAVCVFDTIATTIGGDENSNVDMGRLITACLEIQRVTASNTAPVLIGHPGKDPTKGLRGHSSLAASLESTIRVSGVESKYKAADVPLDEPTGGSVTFHSKKNKEGARVPDMGAAMRSGGRSVYLVAASAMRTVTDSQLALLRELHDAGGTASWSTWGRSLGLHRNTVNASRSGLVDSGYVEQNDAAGLVVITENGEALL